jgi:hypothetical protein
LGSAAASVANSVDSINNGLCSGGATGF